MIIFLCIKKNVGLQRDSKKIKKSHLPQKVELIFFANPEGIRFSLVWGLHRCMLHAVLLH